MLEAFHPVVATWFRTALGPPTEAQERGWAAIREGRDTLIAAPTGSGKTLAAFLAAIDALVRESMEGALPDETRVVYVSPLKALSNDIQKNLDEPLRGITALCTEQGLPEPAIRTFVRTGDTSSGERTAMGKRPPHLLVTTPESLYILLTSEGGRRMLRMARTVIVDEIHALVRDKRGSHLALTLERLDALCGRRLTRIGLSATQKPIEDVASFLVGDAPAPAIIDTGHSRRRDLAIEIPGSPLEPVMAAEVWDEIYDRLTQLVSEHRTTLVFVNTRRLAERVARHLADRLGEEHVTSHHGSLSREQRLRAEQRLKHGQLRALVATASLELGIDIGAVELVCQIGTTRSIATLLQRVGRSGHFLGGTPKGRIFPLSRDELVECAALLDSIDRGELDRVTIPVAPLDVLAQQIVAACAAEEWSEDDLFALARRARPYRGLERATFDAVVQMLAERVSTRRGRRRALLHHDAVHARLRGKKGARLAAITSGGAIPDNADYDVVLEPAGTRVGSLNEDFAIESIPGDVFQLGNVSYRILRIEPGKVRVDDARGQPPTMPFWLGEAPSRTEELSAAVARVRVEIATRDRAAALSWLADLGVCRGAAEQIVDYVHATRAALGTVPTQQTLVLERFFDEAGGMHLVLHAPFGSRVNRAWGLALRKRFCRKFDFELQAAATEDALVLSLGPSHSFPLADVFGYLESRSVRPLLVQALLAAPMFATRWRWNATRALAILRWSSGKKTPAAIQRMYADDLLAQVFPEQVACLENVVGDRELPDHPLVDQTVHDCLTEAMDIERLESILASIESGACTLVARDLTEPSPIAAEVLNAKPYAFLDDAPLEERRTQAVMSRRWLDPETAQDLGALDPEAIATVRAEAFPDPETPDELHDALLIHGFLTGAEGQARGLPHLFARLVAAGRAATAGPLWIAAERAPEIRAAFEGAIAIEPEPRLPERLTARAHEPDAALREIVRGRLEMSGPTSAAAIAAGTGLSVDRIAAALAALEAEGFLLRGSFEPGEPDQVCDKRLLARVHRLTLGRLRREIEPVNPADFIRFLFAWQRADQAHRGEGPESVAGVLEQLEGFEAPAAAWESDLLRARIRGYDPVWLDRLCLAGRVVWARCRPPAGGTRTVRATPIAFLARPNVGLWRTVLAPADPTEDPSATPLSSRGRAVLDVLERHGASFFAEIVAATRLLPTHAEEALGELVARGLCTSDGFAGLRAMTAPEKRRAAARVLGLRRRRPAAPDLEASGRWARVSSPATPRDGGATVEEAAVELVARALLRRWGVVFRRLLDREGALPPWRDLLRMLRRLEARGEIRGGRFVTGFTGEQFALPDAIGKLRAIRREPPDGRVLEVSGADPLNLVGIITPGKRIPAVRTARAAYRDGIPLATDTADYGGADSPISTTFAVPP